MIGGTIIETCQARGCLYFRVRDDDGEETVIGVTRTNEARCVSEGDKIQWTTTQAFWTPISTNGERLGDRANIPLTRVGPLRAKLQAAFEG